MMSRLKSQVAASVSETVLLPCIESSCLLLPTLIWSIHVHCFGDFFAFIIRCLGIGYKKTLLVIYDDFITSLKI
jgi:hypothetical protein